jgi:hypothetical protein
LFFIFYVKRDLQRNYGLNIYIYGTEKFKNNIKSILAKANLGITIEVLNSLFSIKTKLETSPKDIFIIDESKIITTNFLTKKMKFLHPSDGIERELIEKYGVGDVCFNSINGMIGYINSRIKLEEKEIKIQDNKEFDTVEKTHTLDTMQFKNAYDDDDYEYNVEEDVMNFNDIIEPEEVRDFASLKDIDEIKESDIENKMFDHLKV